jgi:hypothetical protein
VAVAINTLRGFFFPPPVWFPLCVPPVCANPNVGYILFAESVWNLLLDSVFRLCALPGTHARHVHRKVVNEETLDRSDCDDMTARLMIEIENYYPDNLIF